MNPVGIHFFRETNFNVISSFYVLSLLIAELQEEKRKNKTNETSEQNLLSEVKRTNESSRYSFFSRDEL